MDRKPFCFLGKKRERLKQIQFRLRKCYTYNHLQTTCSFHSVGEPPCPVQLSHSRVVVKYGERVSINCTTADGKFYDIGWEAKKGGVSVNRANLVTWTVESLKEWDTSPVCFFNPESGKQCEKGPKVILYSKSFFCLCRTLKSVNSTIP